MTHPLDGNAKAADAYYDQPDGIGTEDGDTCGRCEEPEDDNPNPRPCKGQIWLANDEDETFCDTCGEIA